MIVRNGVEFEPITTTDFWDGVVAVVATLPPHSHTRAREVATWMIALPERMKKLIGIPTSISRVFNLFVELMDKTKGDYSVERQHASETWIFTGDRRYKTPKDLTYDDLWVTPEKLEKYCGMGFVLQDEHDRIVQKVYREAYKAGRDYEREFMQKEKHSQQPVLGGEALEEWKRERAAQHAELVGLLSDKASTIEENERLKVELARERSQRIRMEEKVIRLIEEHALAQQPHEEAMQA